MDFRQFVTGLLLALLTSFYLSSSAIGIGKLQEETAQRSSDKADKTNADGSNAGDENTDEGRTNDGKTAPASEITGPATVLTGARIVTLDSDGIIESGSILIIGDKISAIGETVAIPDGAKQIDCTGMTIVPGLIDVRSRLWLDSASAGQSGGAADFDIADGMDPFSEDWIDVAGGGVTAVYLQPDNGDVCAGVGAVVSVAPAQGKASFDSLTILRREAGLQATLGSAGSGRARTQQFERLKKLFTDARKYQEEWEKWNEYQAKKKAEEEARQKGSGEAGEKKSDEEKKETGNKVDEKTAPEARSERRGPSEGVGGRRGPGGQRGNRESPATPPASGAEDKPATGDDKKESESGGESNSGGEKKEEEKPPTEPKPDPVKDRLVRVLKGEIPVHLRINHPDDARRALELAREFELRLILDGMVDSEVAASALLESRFPIVLGPWIGSNASRELPDFFRDRLGDWDGRMAIGSFGGNGRSSRGLRSHAAMAVAAGCDAERALAAVTIDAARILGIAEQAGSIAVGKRGDLAVFQGDPLDVTSPVQMTIVGGQVVFDAQSVRGSESFPLVDSETFSLPGRLPEAYSLTSTRVMTPEGKFETATILVESGKIISVGRQIPEGIQNFDLGDAVVTPGLMIVGSRAGVSSSDFTAIESDARHLSAADGFDPTDRSVEKLWRSGVLQAMLVPPSQNALSGRVAIVRPGAGEPVVDRDAGEKFVLSESARSREKYPSSLGGQREMIESLLADKPTSTRIYLPEPTRNLLIESRTAGTEMLLAGKRLAFLEATTDAETRTALDLIEKHKLNAAITGIENVGKFVDRLVAAKTTLVADPISESDLAWRIDDLMKAAEAGVSLCWNGSSAMQLRQSAAVAIAAGLDRGVAMRALTGGAFSRSREMADLVIWSGHPADMRAIPLAVIIDGQRIENESDGN